MAGSTQTEGRKAFVNAELRDPDDNLLAEANGLMIRLLPRATVTYADGRSPLTTPRAAAVAGVLFALLFGAVLRSDPPRAA